jgi:signal transduction histidine kinase
MKKTLIIVLFISAQLLCQVSTEQKIHDLEIKANQINGSAKVDVYNEISSLLYRNSPQNGKTYALKALNLAASLNYDQGKAVALMNVGSGFYLQNKLDSAFEILKQSIALSGKIGDNKTKAACLNNLGLVYWRKGLFTKALEYYDQSNKLAESVGDLLEVSKSYNYRGLVYLKLGDYPQSLENFIKSLKIKEQVNDKYEIVLTLNNLANIYNELKDYKESLKYSARAQRIAEKINDGYGLGRALNNVGVSYFQLKNYNKAKEIQLKSLSVKESYGDQTGIAYSYCNIGDIYAALGNYGKAIEYYKKALEIREKLSDPFGIATVMLRMGTTYKLAGNYQTAHKYLDESLRLAKKFRINEIEMDAYSNYSNLYESEGDYKDALIYYKLFDVAQDSIYSKEYRSKLVELRFNYESEKKEKEIALLTKENELNQLQINKQSFWTSILIALLMFGFFVAIIYFYFQNKRKALLLEKNRAMEENSAELRELNASKDKFFSIVAHDLKSPFQGLLGFSALLADGIDTLPQDQLKRYAANIKNGTKNVYELIENLLDWSRMQTGRFDFSPEKIDIFVEVPLILELIGSNADHKGITIKNEVQEGTYLFADIKATRSIIQNIVSNAIKFTLKGGEVKISSLQKGDLVEIKVTDTGVGISETNLSKLFKIDVQLTTVGTANEKGTGLGLLLCKEMIEKQGGEIKVESKLGSGSVFSFTLPAYNA